MPRFDADRDDVLTRAWAAGVTKIIIPAVAPETWEPLLTWPAREPRVQVALGIHPQFMGALPEADDEKNLALLDTMLARGGAIAVGECGLDGPSEANASIERQIRVFDAHVTLAKKHELPLLVHCFRAHPHLQRYLKQTAIPEAGLLMHSYSGSADFTKFYVKAGCHFSFAGPVSWHEARRPIDGLKSVPLDRLMAETDAPDQPPETKRGQRNEPAYIGEVIDAMSRILEVDARELTTRNARTFFRWGD